MKISKRSYKYISIVLFVSALVCLTAMIMIERTAVMSTDHLLSPPTDKWESRYLTYQKGWYIDEDIFGQNDLSASAGEDGTVEVLYGPFMHLDKGKYIARVDYECSSAQSVRIYCFEKEDRIRTDGPTVLSAESTEACFAFELTEALDGFEIRVCYDGTGSLLIDRIAVYRDAWKHGYYMTNLLLVLFLFFFSVGLLFLFREYFTLPKERLAWVDFARGFGILLVLFGHVPDNPLGWVVYGFHMPFFFILSGFLYKEQHIPKMIRKLSSRYLLLYLVYSFVNGILRIPYLLIGPTSPSDIPRILLNYIWGTVKGDWREMPNCMPLWFLPALAVSLLLFRVLHVVIKSRILKYIAYSACGLAGYFWNDIAALCGRNWELPWGLHTVLTGIAFIAIGTRVKQVILWDDDLNGTKKKAVTTALLITGLLAVTLNYRLYDGVDLYSNKYGNLFLMYLAASATSTGLLLLFRSLGSRISSRNLLAVTGCHSPFFIAFDAWAGTLAASLTAITASHPWKWIENFAVKLVFIGTLFVLCQVAKFALLRIKSTAGNPFSGQT